MQFPIKRRIAVMPPQIKGAGDIVAMAAEPIKKAILRYAPTIIKDMLKNCNCSKRQEALNKMMPFQ